MNIKDFLLGYEEGKAQGGGSSADVRYVTFMSHDGSVELGKKAVAVGDDCADPIARGIFDTPTKESTAQYNYSFVGWATTPNGAWDAAATDAVTEDRTVYAAYDAALRHYTITYYDADGTTVLKTQTLAYGAMPSYTPSQTGLIFERWEPELSVVTGNAIYTAVWSENITFAGGTWADIARISEAGQAASTFALGDTKEVTINGEQIIFEIAGFNHDTLTDGSGKAGMSIIARTPFATDRVFDPNNKTTTHQCWTDCELRSWCKDALYPALPAEMKAVIKEVNKVSDGGYNDKTLKTTADYIWLPSYEEMIAIASDDASKVVAGQGTKYAHYTSSTKRKRYKYGSSTAYVVWTRSMRVSSQNAVNVLNTSGSIGNSSQSTARGVVIGFCI